MKKQIRISAIVFVVLGMLATSFISKTTVYAAEKELGSSGALKESDYSVEEMLTYAIEDEYLAQAEYAAIMEKYNAQRPFSNIIKAEANHIKLLEPLFEKYQVDIPKQVWEDYVSIPESLNEAYAIGIEAEKKNIEMYNNFLKKDIPDDVRIVFEKLVSASEKHLQAFERQEDKGNNQGGRNKKNSA